MEGFTMRKPDSANSSELEMLAYEMYLRRTGEWEEPEFHTCEPDEGSGLIRVPDGFWESIGDVKTIPMVVLHDNHWTGRMVWSHDESHPKDFCTVGHTASGYYTGSLIETANRQMIGIASA